MYIRPDNLSGKKEPVFSFFTLVNVAGAAIGWIIFWALLKFLFFSSDDISAATQVVHLLVSGIGGLIGILLTFDFYGISLLDRALLFVSFIIRKPMGGTVIVPALPVETLQEQRSSLSLIRDGEVIARPYSPEDENYV